MDPWSWLINALSGCAAPVPAPKPFRRLPWMGLHRVVIWEHTDTATDGISQQPRYPQPYTHPLTGPQ